MVSKKETMKRTTVKRAATLARAAKTGVKAAPRRAAKSQLSAHAKTYLNPFAGATRQPKIPDGKMLRSLGEQSKVVGEMSACNADIRFPLGDPGDLHIFLFPGKTGGLLVVNDTASQTYSGTGGVPASQPASLLNPFYENGFRVQTSATAPGAGLPITFTNVGGAARWRLVSQGLRLACTNPAETDDGWFESCRIVSSIDTNDYALIADNKDQSVGSLNDLGLFPQSKLAEMIPKNIANEPSYETGLVRDLYQKTFHLSPVGDDHEAFPIMDTREHDRAWLEYESWSKADANGRWMAFYGGYEDGLSFINQEIDSSFDTIYIRVHGRKTGDPTKLLYENICNFEWHVNDEDNMAKYQTKGAANEKMHETRKLKQKMTKPSFNHM